LSGSHLVSVGCPCVVGKGPLEDRGRVAPKAEKNGREPIFFSAAFAAAKTPLTQQHEPRSGVTPADAGPEENGKSAQEYIEST
jgi:hypothetical protein